MMNILIIYLWILALILFEILLFIIGSLVHRYCNEKIFKIVDIAIVILSCIMLLIVIICLCGGII